MKAQIKNKVILRRGGWWQAKKKQMQRSTWRGECDRSSATGTPEGVAVAAWTWQRDACLCMKENTELKRRWRVGKSFKECISLKSFTWFGAAESAKCSNKLIDRQADWWIAVVVSFMVYIFQISHYFIFVIQLYSLNMKCVVNVEILTALLGILFYHQDSLYECELVYLSSTDPSPGMWRVTFMAHAICTGLQLTL